MEDKTKLWEEEHFENASKKNKNNRKNKKLLLALVCETLKYKQVLDTLIEKVSLRQEVKRLRDDVWLARVLVYALLFGKGLYGREKDLLSKHRSALASELARMKVRKKVVNNDDLLERSQMLQALPRYVRVNTLKRDVGKVIEQFKQEGYTYVKTSQLTYENYVTTVRKLKEREFTQDIHIQDVLVFSASADLHAHTMYTSGQIIFQDKASCMPAFVLEKLGLPSGSHALDCCAAPGNKTSHLAAILRNNGKIFAFDKDKGRLQTMNSLLKKADASCVETRHQDFLTISPLDKQYRNVEYAIVDPSCSGSGIVSRMADLVDSDVTHTKERLHALSQFQRHILAHALSFPSVRRVVYSTCSLHDEENESVVQSVHDQVKDSFDVVEILPEVPSRGRSSFPVGPKCIRLSPGQDATNGFFIACFQRKHKQTSILPSGDKDSVVTFESEEEKITATCMERFKQAGVGELSGVTLTPGLRINSRAGGKQSKKSKRRKAKIDHSVVAPSGGKVYSRTEQIRPKTGDNSGTRHKKKRKKTKRRRPVTM